MEGKADGIVLVPQPPSAPDPHQSMDVADKSTVNQNFQSVVTGLATVDQSEENVEPISSLGVPKTAGTRVAPGDNRMLEREQDYFGRHESHHQTRPKLAAGAPHEEKKDKQKPFNADVDKNLGKSQHRSDLFPFSDTYTDKLEQASDEDDEDGENGRCQMTANHPEKLEITTMVAPDINKAGNGDAEERWSSRAMDPVESYTICGDPKTHLQFQEETENPKQPVLDNRLVEELSSLVLDESHKKQIEQLFCTQKIPATNKDKKMFELHNVLEKCLSSLPVTVPQDGFEKTQQIPGTGTEGPTTEQSLGKDREVGEEHSPAAEMRESLQWKEEDSKSLSLPCQDKQPHMDKLKALKMVHNLSQQNRLTSGWLQHIYCCWRHHSSAAPGEFGSAEMNNLLNSLCPSGGKGGGHDLGCWTGGKNGKEVSTIQSNSQQHMGELSVEDGNSVRLPVENSFYFSTYAGTSYPSLVTLSRAVADKCKNFGGRKDLIAIIQTLFCSLHTGINREVAEVEEQLRLKKKNVERTAEAETGDESEKEEEQAEKEEVAEKAEMEEMEAKHKIKPDTGVTEKSELEEQEKGQLKEVDSEQQPTAQEPLTLEDPPAIVMKTTKEDDLRNMPGTNAAMEAALKKTRKSKQQGKKTGRKANREEKDLTSPHARKQKKKKRCKTENGNSRHSQKKQHTRFNQEDLCSENQHKVLSVLDTSLQDFDPGQGVAQSEETHHLEKPNYADLVVRPLTGQLVRVLKNSPAQQMNSTETPPLHNTEKKKGTGKKRKKITKSMQGKVSCTKAMKSPVAAARDVNPPVEMKMLFPVGPSQSEKKKFLLPGPQRLRVQGAAVKMKATSDSPKGGCGGSGNGGNTRSGQGGGGRSHDWGGARPKTTRNGNTGGGGDRGDDEDDRQPPRRPGPPDTLPLDLVEARNPRRKDGVPPPNYKRHRKKQHGAITNEQLCHYLGQAGLGIQMLRQASQVGELNQCLWLCLHNTSCITSPSLEDLSCCTCAVLHSLLSHFSTAAHGNSCSMCVQLFTMVHFHVQECLAGRGDEGEEDVSRNVCYKMRPIFGNSAVTTTATKIWQKVRKYLSAALGPALLLDLKVEGEDTGLSSVTDQTQQSLHTSDPPATDLHLPASRPAPEYGATATSLEGASYSTVSFSRQNGTQSSADASASHASAMPRPGGSNLRRRPSNRVVPQKTIPEEPSSPFTSPSPPAFPAQDSRRSSLPDFESLPTVPRVADTPEDDKDIMAYIRSFGKKFERQASREVSDDPYATQKTYGNQGTVSMPETRDRERLIVGEQNLSVEMQPVGVPGIGEVVYGTRQQLLRVARNWGQERDKCKASGHCRYQHREEGVILHEFKKLLKILHTRYQKHQQWERLVHLGNGVTGKCHLCIDRTSNFKFCCKKVHILHYDDQELDIWSELSHQNIVRFYGAIRHGEKIYMFAEFIDGGSLAVLIKDQWTVGKRLSHWMALNYFYQLLHVLDYLQSKGVLHEDIKADNLLLRHGTTEIVLADFGAAQQIPHDHTPPNRYPTGSPAHWSPEKAASEGHGFRSDLWAAACVLIHMLSGNPPWINRFPDAAILNFIIWSKPPPLDDVPENVKKTVRELLTCCLVKDKAIRPTARQILQHPAFQILVSEQSSSFFSFAQPPAFAPGNPLTAAVYHVHQASDQPPQASGQLSQGVNQPQAAGSQSDQPQAAGSQSDQPQAAGSQSDQPQAAGSQSDQPQPAGSQSDQPQPAGSQSDQPQPAGSQSDQSQDVNLSSEGLQQQCPPAHSLNLNVAQAGASPQSAYPPALASSSPQQSVSSLTQQGESEWAFPHTHQEGAVGCSSRGAPAAVVQDSSPRARRVRVVEVARQSPDRGAGQQHAGSSVTSGPVSLPLSLQSGGAESHAQAQEESVPAPERRPVQRKSAPATAAPFSLQGGPAVQQRSASQERVSEEAGNRLREKSSALQQGGRTERASAALLDSVLRFQPELWPDIPSPVLTQASLTPASLVYGSVAHSSLAPSLSMQGPHHASDAHQGRTRSHSQSSSTDGPRTPFVMGAVPSTLSVPGPSGFGGEESSSALYTEEKQSVRPSLASYGTTMDSLDSLEREARPSGEAGALSARVGSPAMALGSAAAVRDGMGLSVTGSTSAPNMSPAASHTTQLSTGRPGTGQPLVTSQTPGFREGQNPAFANIPLLQEVTHATETPRTTLPSASTRSISASSVTLGSNMEYGCNLAPASENSSTGQSTDHLASALYPEYSALTADDFRVSSRPAGMPLLSIIPESEEQESLSPSAQLGSSLGSSEAMWGYIQDQFAGPADGHDQLQQSLQEQTKGRPQLALYAPQVGDGAGDVPSLSLHGKMLPRFELLHSSLSDTSTLRSGRNTSSSGEMTPYNSQLNPVAHGANNPLGSGSDLAPGPLPFPAQQGIDEVDRPSAGAQLNRGGNPTAGAPSGSKKNIKAGVPLIRGNSDEDHISSGDMFGSGPSTSPGFQEALQYRQEQQTQPHHQPQQYRQEQHTQPHHQPQQYRQEQQTQPHHQPQQYRQEQQTQPQQHRQEQHTQPHHQPLQYRQEQHTQPHHQPQQYRQEQQTQPHHQPQQYRQEQHTQPQQQSPTVLAAQGQLAPAMDSVKPCMSKKNPPNLRLYVASTPVKSGSPLNRSESQRTSQSSGLSDSGYSTHTQPLGGDDAFLFGTSPLTASPSITSKSRMRNESGSSASTPKSSTFDKQEQEWTTLQQQTPEMALLLAETDDTEYNSGSEVSSSHHLSLLYNGREVTGQGQEESSMLSMLQEECELKPGGKRLVFVNAEGQFLFDMRVMGPNKSWKELAATFRGQVKNAGFLHFTLMYMNGSPVECFSAFDPATSQVKVMEVSTENRDISMLCWCDAHFIY